MNTDQPSRKSWTLEERLQNREDSIGARLVDDTDPFEIEEEWPTLRELGGRLVGLIVFIIMLVLVMLGVWIFGLIDPITGTPFN